MPYNTTAIRKSDEPKGQTHIPLSRVKKIIAQDPDIAMCSNNAAFIITLAAEEFIQYLATYSHNEAKLERKPRRNIQYKDVANAVARHERLQFLEDMVPKTVPFKKIKATAGIPQATLRMDKLSDSKRARKEAQANGSSAAATGDAATTPSRANNSGIDDDPNEQLELEMRQAAGSNRDADVQMTG
ncbi:DNA polymerase epsilon subunit C [Paramyrothecium foliicola]|nr:DNA polymerase epsilon subunit C [Paramyrothecium foliicola]